MFTTRITIYNDAGKLMFNDEFDTPLHDISRENAQKLADSLSDSIESIVVKLEHESLAKSDQ